MNLLQINDEHSLDVFVDYQLWKCMIIPAMSVTEAYLLIILLVQTDGGVVEVAGKIIEPHPEATI